MDDLGVPLFLETPTYSPFLYFFGFGGCQKDLMPGIGESQHWASEVLWVALVSGKPSMYGIFTYI